MPWFELSPGKYRRPIGEHERLLKHVGDLGHPLGREAGAINVTASFSVHGSFAGTGLRAALLDTWKHLRFAHPSIATYIVDDDTLAYDIPDTTALEEWAASSFKVASGKSLEQFILDTKPVSYMTLTYFAKTGQLLFHTAHWRIDGIGAALLLNAFFDLLVESLPSPSNLQWGQEATRLTPSVEEAGRMPSIPSDNDKALARQCLNTFGLADGAIGIPYRGNAETLPGGTRSARLQLSTEDTKAVIQQCKQYDLSVTAAVHASIASANYVHAAAENKGKHYTSSIRYNLRPYLPNPYSGPEFASTLYATHWMIAVSPTSTWKERAQKYREDYRRGISPEYLSAHREYALILDELVHSATQRPADLPTDNLPSDIDISSLGILDRYVGKDKGTAARGLRVEDVSIGIAILTRQCACFVWSFQERLNLSIIYNDSFHEHSEITSFAQTVKEVLLEELGVGAEVH